MVHSLRKRASTSFIAVGKRGEQGGPFFARRDLLDSRGDQPARPQELRMAEENAFTDFIRRIRAGDEQAAVELVRRYEPAIRREVRFRLRNTRLRRLFDSMDVCQSVLG